MVKENKALPPYNIRIKISGDEGTGKDAIKDILGKKLSAAGLGFFVFMQPEDPEQLVKGEDSYIKIKDYVPGKKPAWDGRRRNIIIETETTSE